MKSGAWVLIMVGLLGAAALFVIDGAVDLETREFVAGAPAVAESRPPETRAHLKLLIGAGFALGAAFAANRLRK